MAELNSGGYHWKDKGHADGWDKRVQAIESDRKDAFATMLELLPEDLQAPLRIVDIGAGHGKVASIVLDRYPNATAVLIDFSQPMIEKGIEQMQRFEGRYRYVEWDMNEGEWPADLAGPFEAAVSSAAIHHLENPRKAWLAQQVFDRLTPGGVFANFDLFRDPDAVFAEDEVHDRTCATLDEGIAFLSDAGYIQITVAAKAARPARKADAALLSGAKPA